MKAVSDIVLLSPLTITSLWYFSRQPLLSNLIHTSGRRCIRRSRQRILVWSEWIKKSDKETYCHHSKWLDKFYFLITAYCHTLARKISIYPTHYWPSARLSGWALKIYLLVSASCYSYYFRSPYDMWLWCVSDEKLLVLFLSVTWSIYRTNTFLLLSLYDTVEFHLSPML